MFKTLKDFDFKGKAALVRCDFNVPLDEKGGILNDFRIKQSLPTIDYLLKQKAKIVLMSHLRRPKGKVVEGLRLDKVRDRLAKYLGVSVDKADDCVSEEVKDRAAKMRQGDVLLLENLRFHREEELNDDRFAKQLAELGDVYVNDAFGMCHRAHASIVGPPKYLPSCAGLLLEREVKVLSRVLDKPWRPLVVVVGGAKIDSKTDVLERFLKSADHVLVGGQVANVMMQAKGIIVGRPSLEPELAKKIEKIDLTSPKLHLPVDGVITLESRQENYSRIGGIGDVRKEESVFDIGPETIKVFAEIIKEAKMILWAGPLGMFEEKQFEKGTKEVGQSIARNHSAFKVAGGGDTHEALIKFNLADKFDHVSTGGGAMLEFVSGKKLPGLEALK
ncbi:MAG: phosphoglycerate kinase [Parcubacteria group bacterium Gr01-1014_30]|nr:MAG: phosphoglycerate kinase [Parcubacteria group bacterium Gr01-1014_30]